ncbi:MAG: methyl-accepting chemotaxis protein [Pseudomonadota bacterium]
MNHFFSKGIRLRTKLLVIAGIVYAMLAAGALISLYNEDEVMEFVNKSNTYVKWMMETTSPDDKSVITTYQGYYENSLAAHNRARTFTIGILLVSLGITLMLGFYFVKAITGPMGRLVKGMQQASQGDLTVRLPVESKDEIGDACVALNALVGTLNDNMAQVMLTANAVTAGTQELSAAAEQLSSSSQEQASSLEETAASMEEMTSTVKQNADNAIEADKAALSAREAANEGVVMSSSLKSSMGAINASSTKIADIIGVIDEIAFQTNMLALNAAVEAARAGEQGRGFAVVAAEVRSLAQRSAAAAKQIKTLIQESVEKVQDGMQLVGTAGKTLEGIVVGVKNTAELIAEISASSQEQASGIEQVNRAVTQMDGVTQSNAAQVEELSGTSQSLAVQAENLRTMISRYKLEQKEYVAMTPVSTGPVTMAAAPVTRKSASVKELSANKGGAFRARTKTEQATGTNPAVVSIASRKSGDWTEF